MRFTPLPPPFSSWHFTFIENIIQLRLPSMSLYNTAAAPLSFTCFGNIYSLFDMWMGNSLIFMIGKTFPHTEKWKAIKVDERLNTWKKEEAEADDSVESHKIISIYNIHWLCVICVRHRFCASSSFAEKQLNVIDIDMMMMMWKTLTFFEERKKTNNVMWFVLISFRSLRRISLRSPDRASSLCLSSFHLFRHNKRWCDECKIWWNEWRRHVDEVKKKSHSPIVFLSSSSTLCLMLLDGRNSWNLPTRK